jgi:hypothetical protein
MMRVSKWLAASALVPASLVLRRPVLAQTASDSTRGIVLQDFSGGAASVHARNPVIKLRIDRHPVSPNERVLLIEYPAATDNPAGRDVWLDVEQRDWTRGSAITFQVKPDHPTRMSVSFADRNHVAFTTWVDLPDTTWQSVRLRLDRIRPNPYFQPPDAAVGKPMDLREVNGLGFAPQDRAAGRIAIGTIVLSR